jgi:AcrR family transcriptional regulator
MSKTRLSGEERRGSILRAAARVFAENGFRGTTTKALAEAAGVSEALLFKHFPSKEAIYDAMHAGFSQEKAPESVRELMAMEPSTATLVRIVHSFYALMIGERPRSAAERDESVLARLMFRSVMEDGEFARLFIRRVPAHLVAKLEQCLSAAVASGDVVGGPAPLNLPGWFTHHLAVMLLLNHLADPPIVDYGVSRATLVEHAVRFALRGIGLKEEAIQRCYHPEESTPRRT